MLLACLAALLLLLLLLFVLPDDEDMGSITWCSEKFSEEDEADEAEAWFDGELYVSSYPAFWTSQETQ